MDEKIENKNEKKSKKRGVLILVILLLLLLLSGAVFLITNREEKNSSQPDEVGEVKKTENTEENKDSKDEDNTQDADVKTVTEKETTGEKEMVSENYRVSQVKFGGNVVIENGTSRDAKLEIYQVKSENILSQEDNEPRILISWKTNKEAISTVEYAKSDGKDAATIVEEGYGFEHTMLIKNMEFSTIYTYRIESADKWGNKINTEYFSAYTGDKSESIFDLITNAIEDVFGWAM